MDANVSACIVDDLGRFKYIQIKIINKKNPEDFRIVIRGSTNYGYHKDIFRNFMNEIITNKDKSLYEKYNYEVVGGGRIDMHYGDIKVYGYSTAYGQADHEKTKEILERFFPTYKVECSNEGY